MGPDTMKNIALPKPEKSIGSQKVKQKVTKKVPAKAVISSMEAREAIAEQQTQLRKKKRLLTQRRNSAVYALQFTLLIWKRQISWQIPTAMGMMKRLLSVLRKS